MDLQSYGIWNWKLVDGKIHVNQTVDLSGRALETLPFKVHVVNGDFIVKGNKLKNLDNFPEIITGNLEASYNCLETLDGFPRVKGLVFLENNNLQSLKGISEIVQEGLDISNNPLDTLEHAPFIESYTYFFHHGTRIEKSHVKIYLKCIQKKCWSPSQTLYENLEKLEDPMLEKMFINSTSKRYGL